MGEGALVRVRVGTTKPPPLTGRATHCYAQPSALAGCIETSGRVPGHSQLHAMMRGAQGEVNTATPPVAVQPVQSMRCIPCRVAEAEPDRSCSVHPWTTPPMRALPSHDLLEHDLRMTEENP